MKLAESLKPLVGRAFTVTAEVSGRADRKLPDIEIQYGKLHIVLEAKYDDFDAAVEAAQNRWHEMQPRPHMVGAVSYAPLYRTDFEGAIRAAAPVEFALCGGPHQDLHAARRSGEIYDLAQALRRPYAVLSRDDDRIENAVNRINGALAFFVDYVERHPGIASKLAELLQAGRNGGDRRDAFSQSARMGGLIVFGAALFQIALAKQTSEVQSPLKTLEEQGVLGLRKHWQFIVEEINYHAIFRLAADILVLDVSKNAVLHLIEAAKDVEDIAHDGIDLMGRIYHQLLADAKTLGAFYTTIPAATMMAGLALHADDWRGVNWASAKSVGKLRIADPACGSGTLLAAAAWQLLDNFSRAHFRRHGGRIGGEQRADPRAQLCRLLLEESIWGYDILETAAHLTAATLGLISPQTDFKKTHIYRTIIGETALGTATGSLEMLEGTMPIFRREEHIESGDTEAIPPLDLCIMNPPFVRGTTGHESFGFLSKKEQGNVHQRVKDLGVKHDFIYDGQGPAFIALACLKRAESAFIREGGRLATILPATATVGMGRAWAKVRAKIEADFDLETVIVSRENGRVNFSEDTMLQECILIARKRKAGEKPRDTALFVVLHKNPATVNAALATVQAIRRAQKNDLPLGDLRFVESARGKAPKIVHDAGYIGQYARLSWRGKGAWRGLSFANIHLAFTAETFAENGNLAPFAAEGRAPLKRLKETAAFVGSNRMHKYTGDPDLKKRYVRISATKTNYAGYYPGYHKQKTGVWQKDLSRIVEHPQCYWLPLPGKEEWAESFFAQSGRIVLCESFGFSTMRRLATLVTKPVQASHYWPIALRDETEEKLKAMTLWLNSTPALLLIAHAASSTYGAKVTFSKKAAMEMPALDVSALSAAQLKKAAKAFDEIAGGDDLLPLPHMENDAQRKRIDDALSEVLGLGDLSKLRGALAVEPIITGKGIGAAD